MQITLNKESECPMGMHKGKKMKDVPTDYLLYMYECNSLGRQMRRYVSENMGELREKAEKK